VPFRLAKMKLADAPFPPFATWKDEVFVLATWPVGRAIGFRCPTPLCYDHLSFGIGIARKVC